MKVEEFIEREFSINENGIILDDVGNKYRNENGEIEYVLTMAELGHTCHLESEATPRELKALQKENF